MSGYSLESKDVKDLWISGNLLFALFDFEFCFLLLGDPNVDFDLFIPEGCGFQLYHTSLRKCKYGIIRVQPMQNSHQ